MDDDVAEAAASRPLSLFVLRPPSAAVSAVTGPAPSANPVTVPNSRNEARKPLRRSGDDSVMKVEAPLYPPPAESPCTSRATKSRMSARMPMES